MLLFFALSHSTCAHDPPKPYYNRNITVALEPDCVRVTYRLELSAQSFFAFIKDEQIKIAPITGRDKLEAACLERLKVLIPDQLTAHLNGQPLTWIVERGQIWPAKDAAAPFRFVLRPLGHRPQRRIVLK